MPDSNANLDPVKFGAMQSDIEHLTTAVANIDQKIDRHNSRMYTKLDSIIQNQHTPPCAALNELQTKGTSIWKTLVIIGAFVVGLVGIAGGVIAIIKVIV